MYVLLFAIKHKKLNLFSGSFSLITGLERQTRHLFFFFFWSTDFNEMQSHVKEYSPMWTQMHSERDLQSQLQLNMS